MSDSEEGKNTETIIEQPINLSRRWKARLAVCFSMLILALIGLMIMTMWRTSYWYYSQFMSLIYAVLSIWLFLYLNLERNRGEHTRSTSTIWHQLAHWLGLLGALYLVDTFVNAGIIDGTQAGLMMLVLLALTIFLVGIYADVTFVFIGVVLAAFAAGAALFGAYLSVVMIPVIIVAAGLIYYIVRLEKRRLELRE